jgi:hypothetical protein
MTALYNKILAHWGKDTTVPYICQGTGLLGSMMLYGCPNVKSETCGILTNTVGYGPMNGFGDPEVIYTIERLMDMAAEKITWTGCLQAQELYAVQQPGHGIRTWFPDPSMGNSKPTWIVSRSS